ncbi:DUF5765 domain-containing protein [Yoonia sediminilitoris]|uniref:Uncharacterized protein n=1 Tax=Yoonia sediminilitoris TaxID=1286148 RepID=A0A2T6KEQ4_9RHOB|nr:DUF5765 domain-containing protein [Yoonia sediminilitoris]PUB13610.1 hypothetical protein C8N45_10770 [Yoonia sediminilitoris]RCW94780.1 hypothetical protein DFP92_10770 [Yoonia sediminilitoris]
MCWSAEVSGVMIGAGAVAAAVTYRRGEAPAIWLTLGYFTLMEALQLWGYAVLDQCGTPANRSVTFLSYLHISLQPFLINAFAMELVPVPVKHRVRNWVYGACAVSTLVMWAQLIPAPQLGECVPGVPLCAENWCTVSGDWHIAWDVPYNGLMVPLERFFGTATGFPTYMFTVFAVPLIYGAWRFVILHAVVGPVLASALTTNPNEMPAIWCLFSIAILLVALSPVVRKWMTATHWWGKEINAQG